MKPQPNQEAANSRNKLGDPPKVIKVTVKIAHGILAAAATPTINAVEVEFSKPYPAKIPVQGKLTTTDKGNIVLCKFMQPTGNFPNISYSNVKNHTNKNPYPDSVDVVLTINGKEETTPNVPCTTA